MAKLALASTSEAAQSTDKKDPCAADNTKPMPECFTDVLYLSSNGTVPPEIKRLLKRKHLFFLGLPMDQFGQLLHRLTLIGTVVIDAKGLDVSQQQKLPRIIESLEMSNIGAILINHRVKLPVRSFALAGPPVKSFSLTSTMESVSIDQLWVRISINLAYRKKGSDLGFTPPAPTMRIGNNGGNKLAEKLHITGALVDNLAEQLRMAGLVQRDFLPARLPDTNCVRWAATFLPAEWVSGDIYDIARIDERYFGFYIADAVGHAMPAALLTIFLKQALAMRETVDNKYRIFTPAEVMQSLNQRITDQRLSGYQFATCCYCLLDLESMQLTYARAGHPYPIFIRPGEDLKLLEAQGSLLGIFEQSEYTQQIVQLRPGDKLFIHSDGAEPFIGSFSEVTGFDFSEEFCRIRDMSVTEMMDGFNQLIRSRKLAPSEVDDITAVALEVL